MSTERTPWLLFEPDGTWDGMKWSGETVDEAGKGFFRRMPSWRKRQQEGWTIRRGEPGEHHRLLAEWQAHAEYRAEQADWEADDGSGT